MKTHKLILVAASMISSLVANAQGFSSNDLAVFEEGNSGIVLDVDADLGNGIDTDIAYSITGGDDASLFEIATVGGGLLFKNTPSFSKPLDADVNNIYQVEVTATLGATNQSQSITVIVSPIAVPLKKFEQIGSALTGAGDLDFAFKSALSADGKTMIIGSRGVNSSAGEVNVYQNINDTWTQLGGTITGSFPPIEFGTSVDINYDGKIVVIGSRGASNNGQISAYKLDGGAWVQIGSDIIGDNFGDAFGASVSISADGSVIAAGAHLDGNTTDRAYVKIYKNVNDNWVQVGDLIPSNNQGDFFGNSISLSNDGTTIAIGAYLRRDGSTPTGEALIFRNIEGTWTQLGQTLVGDFISDFGLSVSMNASGDMVAIGAPRDNERNGIVRVYSFANDSWNQVGANINGTRSRLFGAAVSLSADGSTLAVGELENPIAPGGPGSAYIYQLQSGSWNLFDSRQDGDYDGDNFGFDLNLSADGSTLSVGGVFVDGLPSGYIKAFNVEDIPPVFSTTTSHNFNENETGVIVDIDATDEGGAVDSGITYTITGGTDQSFFDIDGETGALVNVNAFNFESPTDANTDNIYEVNVTASDGAGKAELELAITIQDVNESPVFSSASTASLEENTTSVLLITATDEDAGASVSFSLGSSKDESLFQLIGSDLSFLSAPDHETPGDGDVNNIYEVDVIASDGTLSTTQTISVTVTDVNDNSPLIVTAASLNFDENSTAVINIEATDADATSSLSYSLLSSADQGLFTLEDNALSFSNSPNFESPGDADMDNNYELVVRVSDGTFDVDQAIAISIDDVNEAPVITSNASLSIDENTSGSILTLAATDEDVGSTVTFSLATENDESVFEINGEELSFINAPDAETPLDSDSDNVYEINVIASDGSLETTQTVTVTVEDVNDNSPVFVAAIDVEENTTEVMNVVATDPDQTSTVTITLGTDMDADFFELVDENRLEFKTAPDYENPTDANGDNVYELEIFVTDGLFETVQTVQVTVIDVNEVVLSASEPIATVAVYPNPVSDFLLITSESKPVSWRLVNLTGQVVLADEKEKFETSIDVSRLTEGNYLIYYSNGEEQAYRRIVISH